MRVCACSFAVSRDVSDDAFHALRCSTPVLQEEREKKLAPLRAAAQKEVEEAEQATYQRIKDIDAKASFRVCVCGLGLRVNV